jgi:endonuclease/exonuclease/phosphatase family metal-dependent hydrolase
MSIDLGEEDQGDHHIHGPIVEQCLLLPSDYYPINHGLLLLSKQPLNKKRIHSYHGHAVALKTEGYLAAEIDNLGPVVCTHLTTSRGISEYFGPQEFKSYEEIHRNETMQLLQDFPIDQQGLPPILMGGFNHGPNYSEGVTSGYLASHQLLLDAGYESSYLNEVNQCTRCAKNPLIRNMMKSVIADHVYVKKGQNVSKSQRVFDDNAAVTTTTGLYPLSDHYGIQITYSAEGADATTLPPTTSSPVFVIEPPHEQTRHSGESGVFHCSIAGVDMYQWLKNGHIPSTSRWQPAGEFLLFKHLQLKDNGTIITCRGINTKTGQTVEASTVLTVTAHTCSDGKEFQECGPKCEPTCAEPNPGPCPLACVIGCFCPRGMLLSKTGKCVSRGECPERLATAKPTTERITTEAFVTGSCCIT